MSQLPLEISCAEVHQRRQADLPLQLVDCREQQEHALVAIPGAKLLPMSEIEGVHLELAIRDDVPLVVYCHLGGRSAQVASWLRQQGFPQAQSMAGGIDAWAQEIEPGMLRY